jgi:hypothetical protein
MINNPRAQAIEESEYGLYVWMDTEGKILADDEYRVLSVPSKKGDSTKILALRDYAHALLRDLGKEPGGRPQFWSGRRQISDAEYDEQMMRQQAGLVPDKYDVAALKEQARFARKND